MFPENGRYALQLSNDGYQKLYKILKVYPLKPDQKNNEIPIVWVDTVSHDQKIFQFHYYEDLTYLSLTATSKSLDSSSPFYFEDTRVPITPCPRNYRSSCAYLLSRHGEDDLVRVVFVNNNGALVKFLPISMKEILAQFPETLSKASSPKLLSESKSETEPGIERSSDSEIDLQLEEERGSEMESDAEPEIDSIG